MREHPIRAVISPLRNGLTHSLYAAICCVALAAALTAAAPPPHRQSGEDLAQAARRQLDSVPAVHLHMTARDFSLRLAMDERGNCAGDVDMADQGKVKLVKRGHTVWLAPNAAFWRTQVGGESGELLAEKTNGRYIKGSSGDAMMNGMATTCDLDALRAAAFPADGDHGWQRGTGEAAHHLIRTRGDTTVTMDVSPHGKPYPRKLTRDSDSLGQDVLRLSHFGEPVPRDTPSDRDSLNAKELNALVSTPPSQAV